MFQGSMPGPLLADADLVIVFDTDVPWLPSKEQPPPGARIVQIGEDPLHHRSPMRSFPSDLTLDGNLPVRAGGALEAASDASRATPHVEERDARLRARSRTLHDDLGQRGRTARGKATPSRCPG